MESSQDKPLLLRKSRQRQEILRVLQSTRSHPAADWVYQQVKQSMPNISLGTVYRNLRILQETGDILELKLGSSLSRFDGRTDDHYHFQCEKCGAIHDVEKCEGNDLDFSFVQKTGCTINTYRLEFFGTCQNCNSRCN